MKVPPSALFLVMLVATPVAAHEIILQVDRHESTLLSGHFTTQEHAHDHGRGHHHHGVVADLSGFDDCTTCPVERAAVLTVAGEVHTFEHPDTLPGAGDADAAVSVLVAWPARARTRDGVVALADADAEGVLATWQTRAAITHLVAWPTVWPALLDDGLEMRLLRDPAVGVGDNTVPALVLRDGLPIAGVAVTCNGEPAGMTDDEGRIDVQPGPRGLQRLGATLRIADPDGHVDERRLHAVLTFIRE